MARYAILVALVASGACSSGETSDTSPFPASTLGGPTQPFDVDDADEEDDESSSSGKGTGPDDGGSTIGDPFGEETAAMSSSGAPGESSGGGGGDSTTGVGEESSTGVFMPGNGQPAMGMYADCFEPDLDSCTAFAPVCLMIESLMSGFCTHDMCMSAADCHAAPLDASANPICVEGLSPRGQDVGLCALDCSSGKSCPAGMQCAQNVSFGEDYPIYDFCI